MKTFYARVYEPERGGPRQHWLSINATSQVKARKAAKTWCDSRGWRLIEITPADEFRGMFNVSLCATVVA